MSQNNEINSKAKRILFRSMEKIMKNLQENMDYINKNFKSTQKFINLMHEGLIERKRFFLLASGRSGMILHCFATRLVHFGAEIFMISNMASIPALQKEDILIVLSGSGTTSIVVSLLKDYVNTVKPHAIVSITSHPDTIIGRVGDITIKLKGRTKRKKDRAKEKDDAILTPEGTAFEQVAFTYLDAIIAELAVKMGITDADLIEAHSESI